MLILYYKHKFEKKKLELVPLFKLSTKWLFFSKSDLSLVYKLKRWEVSPKTKKVVTPPAFFFFKKKAKKIP